MTRTALWTKHRPIALAIARDYRIPHLDPDDVRQEALVALWEATSRCDPARGPFPALARTIIHRHLADLLEAATRLKRTARFDHEADPPAPDAADARATLALILEARRLRLSPLEQDALADHLNGVRATSSKCHENALTRARRKLKDAA